MKTIPAKTIVSGYAPCNSWFGTNYNMNIYKGCCHGCIYCDSRSECYHIENFDEVRAKDRALEIIEKELRGKRQKGVVATGSMSDPYNPFEKKAALTRGALELINKYHFGVGIATKSDLVVRDIDILQAIKAHSPVLIKMTITSHDDALSKKIEPYVCPSSKRFEALKQLSDAGIFTGILLMPILPFINDTEENIREIVRKGTEAGVKFIFTYGMGVTLRGNQKQYFYEEIFNQFPSQDLVQRYREVYGNRYECSTPNSKRLWSIFTQECNRLGILYRMEDIIKAYREGYESTQLSLF